MKEKSTNKHECNNTCMSEVVVFCVPNMHLNITVPDSTMQK